jgi:amino-acid N-acetyltransferase
MEINNKPLVKKLFSNRISTVMIRKAVLSDVKDIQTLIEGFARRGAMLARSLNYIYENLRDFHVYIEDGVLAGCCALHVVGWEGLAEVKSLSVAEHAHGKGIGRQLVESCITEARTLGITRAFALTFVPDFFNKVGFHPVEKESLPHKIWSDCINCPFFPDCHEIAVARELQV